MAEQHWVWVARPDYYLEDGADRDDLDPARGYDPDGWWTCDPATRDGDLAVLYRSQVRKDIAHLIAVRSDAERLDEAGDEFDGSHVCRYQILAQAGRPLSISDMRADDVLSTWPALRAAFVQRSFPVPDDVWARLLDRLGLDPEALQKALLSGNRRFRTKRQLQDRLVADGVRAFRVRGWHLTYVEREVACGQGRVDLLYRRGTGHLGHDMVVELKRDLVGRAAVEQVLRYRDILDAKRPHLGRGTRAILVGDRLDDDARRSIRRTRRLSFISIAELQNTR